MKTRLTPYYIDLIYDACLKSFWRKNALRKFLRQCGIAERFLSTWSSDETKRDFLDRLFERLTTGDKGRAALLRMANYLMEQRTFPDLYNWEDSEQKIKAASDAVSKLRLYHEKQEKELESDQQKLKSRKEFAKRQSEITRSQQTLQKLNDKLDELGQRLGTQGAGYEFQDWFFDLLDFSEITNRRPYVHGGRQIDGSLTVSGTTYLVELKFTSEQTGAADIGDFYRKVTSKADNTMGIMVSISGYSSVAKKEASGERTPLLLMDHNHIYYLLGGIMGVADLVNRIRRHASQTGEAYLSADQFSA
jgi:hypothetical protein